MFHSDGAYDIPNFRVAGKLARTNLPSNTAFRGFGGPQGSLFAETWIDHVASVLGLPPQRVREANMYAEGATTHFGQPLEGNRLGACWAEVGASAEVAARAQAVDEYNAQHRYRKRGLAVVPVKRVLVLTFASSGCSRFFPCFPSLLIGLASRSPPSS